MKPVSRAALTALLIACVCGPTLALAAPNWSQIIPFKKVEADPNKKYTLTQDDGPWVIMCRCFAGETAEQDAHALVLELRERYKLKAYVHKQHFDFTQTQVGLGYDKFGRPLKMKPANATEFNEIAVLVGDFETVDDPKLQDVLAKLKSAEPKSLDIRSGKGQTQRFWGLRSTKEQGKGPMRMAFVTRNPLIPEEFFAPKGLDPIVIDMNKNVEHSLLKNPKPYSVRVVSFQGSRSMKIGDIEDAERNPVKKSKLEDAALKANKVVQALRAEGIQAWEFHDVHESIVTVGGFEWVSEKRPDGKDEINPAVHAVMERYKARDVRLPGQPTIGKSPVKVAGVSLDVQPIPVAVPKQSFGQTYAKRNRE